MLGVVKHYSAAVFLVTTPCPLSVAEASSLESLILWGIALVLSKSCKSAWDISNALVHNLSVQLLAFPGCSFQSRHRKCAQKKWRPEKPVWILCGLPPAAEPCQKEPVSTTYPRLSWNTAVSHRLRCFCPDCWWELHEPNTRTRSMLPVLFTSVTLQQRLSAVSPFSLLMKVCLHAHTQRCSEASCWFILCYRSSKYCTCYAPCRTATTDIQAQCFLKVICIVL